MELGLIGLGKMGFAKLESWMQKGDILSTAAIPIRSREENNFACRMLAIMRNAFGGHAVKKM